MRRQITAAKLQPGMTILFNGKITDVTRADLGFDSFGRATFRGHSGELTQVQFEEPKGRFILVN